MDSLDVDCPDEGDSEEPWGFSLPSEDSGWVLVATGVDGQVTWEDGWDSTCRAVNALSFLAELENGQPDWDTLLSGLVHLQALRNSDMGFPPLTDLKDFELIGDVFMTFHGANDYGVATVLYIDREEPTAVAILAKEFETLANRLKSYPPLQPYVEHM